MPSGKEICAKQLYKVIDDIERVEVDEEEIEQFLPKCTASWNGSTKKTSSSVW